MVRNRKCGMAAGSCRCTHKVEWWPIHCLLRLYSTIVLQKSPSAGIFEALYSCYMHCTIQLLKSGCNEALTAAT